MKNLMLIALLFVAGCGLAINSAINDYYKVAEQVKLGDSKDEVLALLSPTQKSIPTEYRKPADKYIQNDEIVEIHYFRSGRTSDGLTTDDEFTPYVFKNGVLVSIGWQALGGPKTTGRVVPKANTSSNYDWKAESERRQAESDRQQIKNQLRQMEHKASFDRMQRGGLP